MKRYITIWWMLTNVTSQIAFQSKFGAGIFLLGKLLRFSFFFLFLLLLTTKTNAIAGYTLWQVIFFYATFNFLDTLPQFFFREVYRFRSYIDRGNFDYILVRPLPVLFRSLFGGSDVLDVVILLLSLVFIFVSASHISDISIVNIVTYILLIINAFLLALAFHILVLGVAVLTTAVDNTIMLYRDLTQMGRLPVDIYKEPLRGVITFVIPIGIMMTFPAKALMGLLSLPLIMLSVFIGVFSVLGSYLFWKYALTQYTSASS